MSCDKCATAGANQIRSPGELSQAIRRCKDLVASGVLMPSDYWQPRTPKFVFVSWNDLLESGPWDDIVQYFFSCTQCDQLFSLHADTYHGSGGRFGKYQAGA